ncbi:GLPGLI family protein [Sphingobacterium sp. JUb56]|uniref:GLPGLI family protein n=1 Tax=Sphingobacterium sp. JUb56 TaxID=2587145 RepID=UPI0016122DBF|nr:GLPGLI family protein [Sphingobacterium sp. JUb56]MBB2953379.1 GLPGLI family protein [Sphingobacterium sp. JUb56]
MKIIFCPLFFLLFQFTVQAQVKPVKFDTKILYKFTYQNDSTSSASRRSVFTQLMIGDQESHFQTLSKFRSDSALALQEGSNMFVYTYGRIEPNNFLIVKRGDVIATYEPVNGIKLDWNNELSYYEEKKGDMQWEMHPDTAHIHDFVCQKATADWGGRKWTAWFTMDIPISDGPYKFCGLPGLVLSISDQDKFFTFDIAYISKVNSVSVTFDQLRPDLALQKTTKESFYKARKNLRNTMAEYALLTGARLSDASKVNIRAEMKTDNNHIERY